MKFAAVLFSILLSISFTSNAQNLNQKDANGQRTGKWVIYQKGTKIKFEEGTFVNGRKEGLWKRYQSDGVNVKIEAQYKNNRPSGTYVKYYPNGKIKEKGTLILNQYRDSLIRFYENGKVEYQGSFNSLGKEQGKITYYYSNGNIEYEYEASNGTPSGRAVKYYENGAIKEELSYNSNGTVSSSVKSEKKNTLNISNNTGKKAPALGTPRTRGKAFLPNGYNKCYTVNDEIWQDGIFKNGQLWDGKVYEYDKDGILIKVKIYKEGVYHSDGQL